MIAAGGPVAAVTVHRGANGGGACVLAFESGAVGNLHLAAGGPVSQPHESYVFYGENGSVTIENCRRVLFQRGVPFRYGQTTEYVPEGFDRGAVVWEPQNSCATLENKALFTQGLYHQMRYFCDRVLSGEPAEQGSLEFGLEVMRVYEAALLSKGDRVPLEGRTQP